MADQKPAFSLRRVAGGSDVSPSLFVVREDSPRVNRRAFVLAAAASAQAALVGQSLGAPEAASQALFAHRHIVASLEVTPDNGTLLSTTYYGDVKKWHLPGGALAGTFPSIRSSEATVSALGAPLCLTPDGTLLVTSAGVGEVGGKITLWSYPTGQRRLNTLMGHARRIVGLFVSSDGKTLVSASEDPEVRVWSLATGRALKVLDGPPEGIESMVLSPNGSVAAAGGSRGSIRVWGLPEGNVLLESKVASGISALAINRNNNVLAAGLGDGDLVLWSLDSGAEQRRISLGSWIRAMIVAPDGSSVIAGTNAGVLNVCSMLVENEVQSFRTSTSGVSSLRLATKKNLLAVGSVEGQILLYQWPEMKLRSYLFDPTDNNTDVKGISYNVYDKIENRSIAYTMPCGTAIPVGATCICNCVPGRHTDVATSSRGRPSPPAVPGSRRDTLTLPCTPTPPPPGYVCTCNCVPGR